VRVLVVDNYDSFVYNLVQYLAQLGADTTVRRNDEVDLDELDDVDAVLVSPGPGTPERAGSSIDVIRAAAQRTLPLLGVCLGHQAIGVAWGGVVAQAPELLLPLPDGVPTVSVIWSSVETLRPGDGDWSSTRPSSLGSFVDS